MITAQPPIASNAAQILNELFAASLEDLIGHYCGDEVKFLPVEASTVEAACAASVGFSDKQMRGAAILTVSHIDCVAKIGAPDGCSDTDWVGELGNQLVGRFKNKLAKYGHLIDMGLPSVICGKELRHGTDNRSGCWHLRWFDFDIHALLNLDVEDGMNLQVVEEEDVAEEGSLCFF